MTEIETDIRDTPEWRLFETVIVETATSLAGVKHDIHPLFEAMGSNKVRSGLITYVLTNGDTDLVENAMFGDGERAQDAMAVVLRGEVEPSALLQDAFRYLYETVQWHADSFDAPDETKAHLWAAGAAIAFCLDEERIVHLCIDNANALGGTTLASLVSITVARGIRPAWARAKG